MIELEWDDVDEQLNHMHTQTFYPFYFLPAPGDKRRASISIFSLLGDKKELDFPKRKEKGGPSGFSRKLVMEFGLFVSMLDWRAVGW